MKAPINALIMSSPTFLIAGLDDGSFVGWDLSSNAFNTI